MPAREYDVIVVGATGLTGRLVAEHLARCDALTPDASGRRRWAVSGRNPSRTVDALRHVAGGVPDIVAADLAEPTRLPDLTRRAAVVINLAGPYTPTATNLIAACVETRTSYVDLSGEIPLLKTVIDRFHGPAVDAGIRIVQMAGWEALPADLTTLLASRRAVADGHRAAAPTVEGPGNAHPVERCLVTARFTRKPDGNLPVSEAVSAGTLASIVEMLKNRNADLIGRPDALLPPSAASQRPRGLRLRPFDDDGRLIAPFTPVAFLNAPVVHRTAALLAAERGDAYQPGRYLEGDELGASSGFASIPRIAEAWVRTGMQQSIVGLARAPGQVRSIVSGVLGRMVPAPGTGPSGRFQTDWEWRVQATAATADGRTGEAVLDGRGHPGYWATAAMIAEVGVRIALGRATERVGCLTPALALGSQDLDPWFVDCLSLH
jgi:short subunit dehydrogenase-like uncharacterized protein